MSTPSSDDRAEQIRQVVDQLTGQGFTPGEQTGDQWAFLVDPGWQAENPDDGVPLAAIVGGWLASADGTLSRFHPNPDYEPSTPGSPTDPVDATLQLVVRGESTSEMLFAVIKESTFAVALDDDDTPVVAPSPDDVPSLLVTTAPLHQGRVRTDKWRDVSAVELADLLVQQRVDLLLNPGAPSSMRLIGEVFARNVAE
ncbi:type VII secretion system-associated protein [Umezawaea sp. NPDC059074]|uniref:type VII secretion system-associated protein n=1 Tax=Umezawaea sp. NPDC059074 TaxID=3346716 RepID=UPI0036B4E666